MEEVYREESGTSFERKVFAAVALILIGCLYVYEWEGLQETKRFNLLGWGIDTVLLCLWVWRVSITYTLILYKNHSLKVVYRGLGVIRYSYTVDLARTESFTNKYVKSFFRKTKINRYIHSYSSLDNNPQRLLVFSEGKKNKLVGLLFKASDKFVHYLRKQMPDKYIQL